VRRNWRPRRVHIVDRPDGIALGQQADDQLLFTSSTRLDGLRAIVHRRVCFRPGLRLEGVKPDRGIDHPAGIRPDFFIEFEFARRGARPRSGRNPQRKSPHRRVRRPIEIGENQLMIQEEEAMNVQPTAIGVAALIRASSKPAVPFNF